jgi:MFS family permease
MRLAGDKLTGTKKRDYRLILSAAFLYGLVDGLLFITLAIYVSDESGSLPMVGFIISLPFLAIFIMSFVWGAISDRIGSYKWVIIAGNIITGFFFLPMPFVSILGLFVIRAIQVFFYSVNILAVAVVTEMLPDTKGEAAGTVSLFTSAGWLIGGMASGFVYFYGDVILLFPVCAVMSIMTGMVLLPMQKLDKIAAIISIKDTFKLKNSGPIGFLLLIIGMTFVANRAIFTVFPVYLKDAMDMNIIHIGVLSAMAGLVGAFVVVSVGKFVDRYGRRPMFVFAVFTYLFSWILLFLTDNLILIIILWCIPSWAFMTISATAMISDLTSSQERGRGIGALNSAHNLGQFIGAVLMGLVATSLPDLLPGIVSDEFKGVFLFAAMLLLIPFFLAFKVPETLKKKGRTKVRVVPGPEEE